jgi:hypothetical protein
VSEVVAVPLVELVLTGDLTRPPRLTVPDLLGRPQHRARVSFECATSGVRCHDPPLDGAGPQLVLPQGRCGARDVSGIRAIPVDGGYGYAEAA